VSASRIASAPATARRLLAASAAVPRPPTPQAWRCALASRPPSDTQCPTGPPAPRHPMSADTELPTPASTEGRRPLPTTLQLSQRAHMPQRCCYRVTQSCDAVRRSLFLTPIRVLRDQPFLFRIISTLKAGSMRTSQTAPWAIEFRWDFEPARTAVLDIEIKDRSRPGANPSNWPCRCASKRAHAESAVEMHASIQPLATTPS
jgi:hypothetical protein